MIYPDIFVRGSRRRIVTTLVSQICKWTSHAAKLSEFEVWLVDFWCDALEVHVLERVMLVFVASAERTGKHKR
jgi:hypothetical protein